jgi:hypothetical protein
VGLKHILSFKFLDRTTVYAVIPLLHKLFFAFFTQITHFSRYVCRVTISNRLQPQFLLHFLFIWSESVEWFPQVMSRNEDNFSIYKYTETLRWLQNIELKCNPRRETCTHVRKSTELRPIPPTSVYFFGYCTSRSLIKYTAHWLCAPVSRGRKECALASELEKYIR